MISVVIPLYNKEKQIANTLRTVFAQSFQEFEILIVNDGSTDNSVNEVLKLNDSRIRLLHQANAGVSAARNKGVTEAKYNLIAFLDADDEWKVDYLATQYELYKRYPECSVYACNYEFRDSKGKYTPTTIREINFTERDGVLDNYFEVASYSHPPICSISILVKKETILSIGGFPIGVKSGEDLLTWARLATTCKIAYSKIPLAIFITDPTCFNIEQKNRMPSPKDLVGNELQILYKKNPHIKGLKEYNALWHKMRAKKFLIKNKRKEAIIECFRSIQYNPSYKVFIFFVLALFPYKITKNILI